MTVLLVLAGTIVVLLVIGDFLMTTISLRKQGMLTRAVSRIAGTVLRSLPFHAQSYGGPITLSSLAAVWIVGLWIGWTLIFFAWRSELGGPEEAPGVGLWDTFAFAGSTLSSMGLGVVTPLKPWLHIVTVLAAVSGILVLTLSVTYVLNVSQVASRSRSTALQLRDTTHVLQAAPDDPTRASILIERSHALGTMLHSLADERDSFPLAQLYEVEGSERDVARRAETMRDIVEDTSRATMPPHERTQLDLLVAVLGRLTRDRDEDEIEEARGRAPFAAAPAGSRG